MRTFVEEKCRAHAARRFVIANAGRVCCAADTLETLCRPCREVVTAAKATMRPPRGLPPLARQQGADSREFGRGPLERRAQEEVPPAPNLHERIREHRARLGKATATLVGDRLRAQMAARHSREFGGR